MKPSRDDYKTVFLVLLPYLLFYLSFRVFSTYFLYSMAISTFIMALSALALFPSIKGLYTISTKVAMAIPFAGLAYLLFYLGWVGTVYLGLSKGVYFIYDIVPRQAFSLLALMIIGLSEEPYWRGFIQKVVVKDRLKLSWPVAALFYGIVHIVTGDLVLPLAAFVFGLVMSWAAERYGLLTSSVAHVLWLYIILYLVPVVRLPLP
ncbi:MAG: CPBP family intramembrane glutamic endopeptidase [Acidilobus sp.]